MFLCCWLLLIVYCLYRLIVYLLIAIVLFGVHTVWWVIQDSQGDQPMADGIFLSKIKIYLSVYLSLSLYENRITPIIITDITGRRNIRIQNPYTCTTSSGGYGFAHYCSRFANGTEVTKRCVNLFATEVLLPLSGC